MSEAHRLVIIEVRLPDRAATQPHVPDMEHTHRHEGWPQKIGAHGAERPKMTAEIPAASADHG